MVVCVSTALIAIFSDSNSQVGGRVVHYDKMTFATVRGAGHMVSTPSSGGDICAMFN